MAVKVARPELAGDPHFRERFRAEVAAARSVGGFHTAPVVDADPAAAAPWLATAYIPGPTLSALLEAEGPMDEARLRRLGAALAEALAAIHGCGLVHRDLKPGNIIMAPDGPRVLDFGIARALESTRLTATGTAFGTPGFLAPEQAQGQEVDGAADVFALGAVLVAAAGGSAFGAGTPMGMMYRSVHEAPDLAAVPEGLRPVLAACLAKNPAERPTPHGPAGPVRTGRRATLPRRGVRPHRAGASAAAFVRPVQRLPAVRGAHRPRGRRTGRRRPHVRGGRPGRFLLIDAAGVTLGPEGAEAHYSWAEISTVTYAAEGPKHLKVVVHPHRGTAHPCLVAARRRGRLQEWLEDLPLILECFA